MPKFRVVVNGENPSPDEYGTFFMGKQATAIFHNSSADGGFTYVWAIIIEDTIDSVIFRVVVSADAYAEEYCQDCVAVRVTDCDTDAIVYESCPGLRPWTFNSKYFMDICQEEEAVS